MSIVVKQDGQMENNISANGPLYTIRGLVSRNPGVIIRLALPVFLLMITAMATIAWFVKYPEVIKAATIVTGRSDAGMYEVEVGFASGNLHKIKPGQQLRLQFVDYPHYKLGYVPAIVHQIVDSASGKLQLRLPQGLFTNRSHPITYRPGLQAQAIIFVKDLRLLERMLKNALRVI